MTDADRKTATTILDVARAAGVSRTTVSRVLNEPERVPAKTLARVLDAVAALNYQPSAAARTLRNGRSGTIALIVGDISQPWLAELAKGAARAASELNINVVLCDLDHSDAQLLRFLERLPRQGVDGIMIATGDDISSSDIQAGLEGVRELGVPLVLSMRRPQLPQFGGLEFVFSQLALAAATHLIESGCTSIALLVGKMDTFIAEEMTTGCNAALAAAGLTGTVRLLEGGHTDRGANAAVSEMLASGERVDAIVSATVVMAVGALRAIQDCGLSLPRDVSLFACEDVPLARQVTPPISTIGTDANDNGVALVRLLQATIAHEDTSPDSLPFISTVRETSR